MMRIAGFEFSEGARFQPGAHRDANAVGRHLEMLRQKFKGEITPQDVLDDAKNPNSPLHSFFEWSDSEAAQQYRLQQARGLIRAVVAVYTSDDAPAQRQKAYVHIADNQAPHYRETTHALSQKKTRELVLKRAWQELQQWKARYKDLAEFARLVGVIEALEIEMKPPAGKVGKQ